MVKFDFDRLSSHGTPEESLGFLLWRSSAIWRRAIEAVLKPLDLTHPQFVILATVAWLTREGEKASQAAMGRHAGLDPNTTSQVLRALQAKRWVERKRSEDERSKYPILTAAGSRVLAKALPAVEAADKAFFKCCSKSADQTLRLLQKLAQQDA